MPNRLSKLFAISVLIVAFAHCRPEESDHPCDDVSCANGGACINGFCDCPDGFGGELCLETRFPEAAWITGIEINNYPTFRGDLPWDSEAEQPDCWPDFAVGIDWPWSLATQSHAKLNAEGNPLFWGQGGFPYLANHFHPGDTLRLFLVELDGLDSAEVIGPPEVLLETHLTLQDIVLADSLDPFPTSITLTSDSSATVMRCGLRYEFDH